jgi:coatomer subunit beta'
MLGVQIWSLHSGKSKYTLIGHLDEVNCLDFFTRGDQQYLISGSDDFSLRVYYFNRKYIVLQYMHNIANNAFFVLEIQICDLQKKACVHTIEDLMSPVISLVSLPDRPYIIIGLQDGTAHLWNSAHFE